jgi:EAL domain-containing protein (putative c-di-GMP-specific phosphodiesterase class I)
LESELSRLCRAEAMLSADTLVQPHILFLNTHPRELTDLPRLIDSLRDMRTTYPEHKLALEIHEAAVTEPQAMHELRAVLAELDILLAYDDFGAGQARFVELVEVPPHFLKFDMKLIQGIHQASAARQQMLSTLVRMARDLGIETLAEGVECQDENRTCVQMGFDLGQGFLYGRPAPVTAYQRDGEGSPANDEEPAAIDCR